MSVDRGELTTRRAESCDVVRPAAGVLSVREANVSRLQAGLAFLVQCCTPPAASLRWRGCTK